MSTPNRLRALHTLRPYVERARRLHGWSLAVEPVRLGPGLPWDYMARARELVAGAASVLDLGTGGGERFAQICEGFGGGAVATEAWAPNVLIAAERLSSSGVQVVQASSLDLPFADASFDLVLDRHEELDPSELARVLAPGGRVLTQQVHHGDWQELRRFFPRMSDFGDHFTLYRDGFRSNGLTVVRAETHDTRVAYANLGEVAYMLAVTPWTVPDFDLERDIDALLALERGPATPDGIVLTESRYIIEARKPAR